MYVYTTLNSFACTQLSYASLVYFVTEATRAESKASTSDHESQAPSVAIECGQVLPMSTRWHIMVVCGGELH